MAGAAQRKHTDEQRDAIVTAVLDRDPPLSVPAALKAAASGELTPTPFDMKPGIARHYVRKAREQREPPPNVEPPELNGNDPAADLAGRLYAVANIKVAVIEQRGAAATPEELLDTAKAIDAIRRLDGRRPPTGTGRPADPRPPANTVDTARPDSWVLSLPDPDERSEPTQGHGEARPSRARELYGDDANRPSASSTRPPSTSTPTPTTT